MNPGSWLSKRFANRPFAAAFWFAATTVAAFFLLFQSSFETNDDAVMAMIASGTLSDLPPDPHLLFTNIIVGRVLAWLYSSGPPLPWYGIYLAAVHGSALVGIAYAVVRVEMTAVRWFLVALFGLTVELYQWRHFQFTNAASMCAIASILLVCSQSIRQCKSPMELGLLLGLALAYAVLAILVRSDALLLAGLVSGPVIAAEALANPAARRPFLIWSVAVGVAYVGLTTFDKQSYESDPAWRGFAEFNALRNRITDYSPDTGEDLTQVAHQRSANLAAAGWTKADFHMLNSWAFVDATKFNVDAFRRYLAEMPRSRSVQSIRRVLSSEFLHLRTLPCLFLVGCALFHVRWDRRVTIVLAATILAAMGSLIYLAAFLKLAWRVCLPTMSFVALLSILYARSLRLGALDWGRVRISSRWSLSLTALAAVGLLGLEWRDGREQAKRNRSFRADISKANLGPNSLLVSWGGGFPFECILPFESLDYLKPLRCIVLGWPIRTPFFERPLRRFGIDDLLLAAASRSDILIVAPPPHALLLFQDWKIFEIAMPYFAQTYGIDLTLDKAFAGQTFDLLKFGDEPRESQANESMERRQRKAENQGRPGAAAGSEPAADADSDRSVKRLSARPANLQKR